MTRGPIASFSAADDRAIRLGGEIGLPAASVGAVIGQRKEAVLKRAAELGAAYVAKRMTEAERAHRVDRLRIALAAALPRAERPDSNAEEAAHRRACAEQNRKFAEAMIAAAHFPTCDIAGVWEPGRAAP